MLVNEKNARFKAVRAGGPGGERANRRSTKVQVWVKVADLPLSDRKKKLIRERLKKHINHRDELEVANEEERSQELNRDNALRRINELLENALKEPPERIPIEPPRRAKNFRIKEKKILSEKKKGRRVSKW